MSPMTSVRHLWCEFCDWWCAVCKSDKYL